MPIADDSGRYPSFLQESENLGQIFPQEGFASGQGDMGTGCLVQGFLEQVKRSRCIQLTFGVCIGILYGARIPNVVAMQASVIALLCGFKDDASQARAIVSQRVLRELCL
jgi:hypothetical protein